MDYPIKDLRAASNNLGVEGARVLLKYSNGKLEGGKGGDNNNNNNNNNNDNIYLKNLHKLDLSQNQFSNGGIVELTKVICRCTNLTELRLGHNKIESLGVETMMNKLLQHKIEGERWQSEVKRAYLIILTHSLVLRSFAPRQQ